MTGICRKIKFLNKTNMKDESESRKEKKKSIEKFIVEGTDWKVGIAINTEDFDSRDDLLIECATRGIEYAYHSNPEAFKLGAYLQITVNKPSTDLKWVNSFTALINASMYEIAKKLKENVKKCQNVDIETEKRVI